MSNINIYEFSCPNCGSPLDVDIHKNDVTCPFCRSTIKIDNFKFKMDELQLEREQIQNQKIQAEAYVDIKARKQRKASVIVMAFIIFIAALIALAGIIISANIQRPSPTTAVSRKSEIQYTMIKDIKDVPEVRLKKLEKQSIENLEDTYTSLRAYTRDSVEIKGHYLACQKDSNYIITVVKSTYHNNKNEELVLYSPFYSDNIYLNEDGQSEFRNSKNYCKRLGLSNHYGLDFLHGYTSLEDLYFEYIESNEKVISVTATDGMYIK